MIEMLLRCVVVLVWKEGSKEVILASPHPTPHTHTPETEAGSAPAREGCRCPPFTFHGWWSVACVVVAGVTIGSGKTVGRRCREGRVGVGAGTVFFLIFSVVQGEARADHGYA